MDQPEQTKKTVSEREQEVSAFWEKEDVFKKSLQKKSPKGEFVFYDGPPFATGLPHYGHILAGTIKDVIPRFKTMQGYHVPRRWGWDCHGLPVENIVEKELGFKSKKDIVEHGIEKFNASAKETVMRYSTDWRTIIPRLGRWVDMVNDYRTMDTTYTESVWWSFKTLHDKGLIYEGFKSMHLCPRCETTLSNFEVTQGYKELTDTSVFVTFPLTASANTFAVAWTTTPWTLPGNVALAVNPEFQYAFVFITASNAPELPAGNTYIVGADEAILKRVFGKESFQFDPSAKVGSFTWNGQAVSFEAKKGVLGKELIGQSYRPLFDYYAKEVALQNRDRGWRVYGGSFVTESDGTGIVHIAPAFGEDDYNLAVQEKLPFVQHVGANGVFKPEVTDFAGLSAKPKGNPKETDEKITALLKERGGLLYALPFTHQYPHCWRCETPLLNFSAPSWFVKVSSMREKLVEENKKVTWVPKDVGEFRFGNWLAEAKDWAVSRSRFWGAPIPAWRCERCHALRVVGSIDELRKGTTERITKVTLLRHGESVKNREHIMDDSTDKYPLTHEGKSRAKESAERILKEGGVDAIFTSPMLRTKETAEIVGKHLGKEVSIEEGLREVDSGDWDEKKIGDPSVKEAENAYYALSHEEHYTAVRGTTGESWKQVEERIMEAFARILEKHKGDSILLVTHEGPMIYLEKALRGLSLEETNRLFKEIQFESYAEPITLYFDHVTNSLVDLHRPYIDDVRLSCEECAKKTGAGRDLMVRVSEVFDCWYESGSMPFAQAHYPFNHSKKSSFNPEHGWLTKSSGFPADFIAEGLDQTRGWFYSLLVLGTALFDTSPFKSVVVNGIILAENGAKMSKRLKNYPDPLEVVEKYGADSLRWYLLASPVVHGEDLRFNEKGVDEVSKKIFGRLDNVLQFYLLYADTTDLGIKVPESKHVLDRWITERLHQLISEVTTSLEGYELDKAIRPIGEFIDDLSTWYLRRSRDRIKSDDLDERLHSLTTLRHTLQTLAKVMAPFAPFFAEYLFDNVKSTSGKVQSGSVHLEEWPGESSKFKGQNAKVLGKMEEVRRIVSLGLEARTKVGIKVRQPLQKLKIKNEKLKIESNLKRLIQDEVNVKEVVIEPTIATDVELDTTLTPALKEEGQFRELVRTVQEMRKKLGLSPSDQAELQVKAEGLSVRFIEQFEQELSKIASLRNVVRAEALLEGGLQQSFTADEIALNLRLSKE